MINNLHVIDNTSHGYKTTNPLTLDDRCPTATAVVQYENVQNPKAHITLEPKGGSPKAYQLAYSG